MDALVLQLSRAARSTEAVVALKPQSLQSVLLDRSSAKRQNQLVTKLETKVESWSGYLPSAAPY